MSATTRVGTLTQCPRCRECCFAVMVRNDGSLYLARHGGARRWCYGPSSSVLIDLLMAQHGLTDDGGVSAR